MVSSVSALRTDKGDGTPCFDLLVVALGKVHGLVNRHTSGLGDVGGDFTEEIFLRLVFRLGLLNFRLLKPQDRLAAVTMLTLDGNIAIGNLVFEERCRFETACRQAIATDFSEVVRYLGSAPSRVLRCNGFLHGLGIAKVEDELTANHIALG